MRNLELSIGSLYGDMLFDLLSRAKQLCESGAIDTSSYSEEKLAEILLIASLRDVLDKRTAKLQSNPQIVADLKNLRHF